MCSFANTNGGRIFIGIDDNGNIFGLKNIEKLLNDIPSKIKNSLEIIVDIIHSETDQKDYIEIKIDPHPFPISYKGRYYKRMGATTNELTGTKLDNFLLGKMGKNGMVFLFQMLL
ncbi:MAG: ATP-binding protein [Bacteroidota bacterium]|nr:ATP-binding protein [Bacteroidota bacterium]